MTHKCPIPSLVEAMFQRQVTEHISRSGQQLTDKLSAKPDNQGAKHGRKLQFGQMSFANSRRRRIFR